MNIDRLWLRYKQDGDYQAKQKIIIHYLDLVRIIAHKLYVDISCPLDYEDMVSYGIIGLIDAVAKYDCRSDVKFESYASRRIRGQMIDQLRRIDWLPRRLRRQRKRIDEAIVHLQNKYGENYSRQALADQLEMSLDNLYEILREVARAKVLSLDRQYEERPNFDVVADWGEYDPQWSLDYKTQLACIKHSVNHLPARQHKIIHLYYYEEQTYQAIGDLLGISIARVSQLHKNALKQLKSELQQVL